MRRAAGPTLADMDYAELFERQGLLMDDLLLHAFKVPQDRFVAPGEGGAPSLRDLLVEWIEMQRRTVHASIQERPYVPLPAAGMATVPDVARAFGGFRLTLLEVLDGVFAESLTKKVTWTGPGGAARDSTLDEVLAHLVLHGARMMGLVAQRLRQLGQTPPPTDLLS